jgi:hypothetical protein
MHQGTMQLNGLTGSSGVRQSKITSKIVGLTSKIVGLTSKIV